MAKAAKFDREEVIGKATNLYWKKGFHATSMRNLQDEIDMRPGSIYAAFGSKDGLFKEALRNYTVMGIELVNQYRNEHQSPIAVLKAIVKSQVIDTIDDAPNGVCMLAKTLSELTEEHQELIDITRAHLAEIADEFIKVIEEAQALGEIKKEKSAQELANYLQVQIAGLRTFAKMNGDREMLESMIESTFSNHPF
jgi:AcrR family transcriptional regulator